MQERTELWPALGNWRKTAAATSPCCTALTRTQRLEAKMREPTSIIDLRPHNTQIIHQLASLVYEAFLEHAPGWLPTLQVAREEIIESLQPKRVSRVLVDVNGKPMGWIAAIAQSGGRMWEIHPLAVAASHHGQGFGRRLVDDIEQLAKQHGVLTLVAGTSDQTQATTLSGVDLYKNPAAAIANIRTLKRHPYEFWIKVGFTVVGIMPDAEGVGNPAIMLAKRVGA